MDVPSSWIRGIHPPDGPPQREKIDGNCRRAVVVLWLLQFEIVWRVLKDDGIYY